jgi:hypothetical protein
MIELLPATAVMLYLGISLTTLLSLWIFHHYQSRTRKVILQAEKLLVCEYCHCAYLADIAKKVTRCPDCSSYNKNNPYKKPLS